MGGEKRVGLDRGGGGALRDVCGVVWCGIASIWLQSRRESGFRVEVIPQGKERKILRRVLSLEFDLIVHTYNTE